MPETNGSPLRNGCLWSRSPVAHRTGRRSPESERPRPGPGRGGWMFSNADEVLKYIKDEGVEFVDVRFCDLPGVMQHFTFPAENFGAGGVHRRPDVRRLVDPRLPGHPRVGHAPAAGPDHGADRPVPPAQDAQHRLLHPRPAHRRGLHPRPAQHRHEGRGVPQGHRHRATRRTSAPRPSSTSSTRPLRHQPALELLLHRLGRGRVEHRPRGGRAATSATSRATRAATSRSPPTDHFTDLRSEMVRMLHRVPASTSRCSTTRSAPPARRRSTSASTRCSRPPTT